MMPLELNGVNLMRLMAAKDIYFVPYGQDNPDRKPSSMVARMSQIRDTIVAALEGTNSTGHRRKIQRSINLNKCYRAPISNICHDFVI